MASRDPERTRSHLLEAAATEFAAHGYAGARVARIAHKARANQRMVYHYFGSKEGLYEATYLRLDEEMIRRLGPIIDRLEAEPLEGFADGVRRYFDLVRQLPNYSRLFVGETLERKRRLRYELTSRDPGFQLIPRLMPLLERGRASGQLSDQADAMVALMMGFVFALMYPLMADRLAAFYKAVGLGRGDPDAQVREQLVKVLLHGIAGPRAKPVGGGPLGSPPARRRTRK
jgi:AcrR family transcriptional regulator